MKQLTERAKLKIIALVSEVDVDNTTVQDICVDLRNRGFKPPHGTNWTERKLLEVIEVKTVVCPLCRQKINADCTTCPECWTKRT